MYEDGIDGDSLKEVLANAIKRIDIGAAVLPEPLFNPDVDELDEHELLSTNSGVRDRSCDDNSDIRNSILSEDREGRVPDNFSIAPTIPTRYARTLRTEFNSIVVEHHLKWAPLCVSEPGPFDDGSPSLRLGRYDFHHADAIVDWAIKHKMKVKGHVLVWHVTS